MALDAISCWAGLPCETAVTTRDAAPAAPAELDDAGLVAATLAGDRAAFDEIVRRHQRHVYQVCYRFVNNPEDASDLAQDVFVRAWKGLARFRGQSALSTWLHRIAVNASLNRVSVKRLPVEPIGGQEFVDQRASSAADGLMRDERAARVRAAIAQLPAKQRATLVLRIYHELPHEEIARQLGGSVGAAKANLFHALGNLKRILGAQP